MINEGITIIESSGHQAPDKLIPIFKANHVTWIHKCAGVRYAKKAESLGADIVEVVGWENGGATGVLDIASLVLIPRTVDAVSIPVIGGGGVGDGRGLAAVLALGAEAAIVGTRFLAAAEAPIHPRIREELIRRTEADTTLVLRSIGNTHRVLRTANADKARIASGLLPQAQRQQQPAAPRCPPTPSTSAAIWARIVSEPVPRSVAPMWRLKEPSSFILIVAAAMSSPAMPKFCQNARLAGSPPGEFSAQQAGNPC
jgi:NAD(P)H-dependent flavin oxidoreductase YrpB (nitropropane dioxygenase family)